MSDRPDPAPDRSSSDQLHPWVYRTFVGLAALLVVSVWGFFAEPGSGFALVVVSLFFVVAVAIPALLWQIWRRHRLPAPQDDAPESFAHWAARDFALPDDRVSGRDAALEALLPIAAVALGMAAFAIVLHLSVAT